MPVEALISSKSSNTTELEQAITEVGKAVDALHTVTTELVSATTRIAKASSALLAVVEEKDRSL